MLRDRIVCGIKDVRIQQRLLSEKSLTLKQTLTIAYSMESAATYSKSIADHQTLNSTTDKINKILKVQPKTFEKKCYRCSGTKHTAQNCPFKEAECFYCHQKGHTIQVYQTKAANEGRDKRIPNRQRPVKIIETIDGKEEDEIFDLYTLHERKVQPFAESLKLEGNIVSMEIDTGASITLIGEQIFKIILPHCSAKPSHLKLKIVTGEIVQPNGSVNVEVEYQKQKQILPLTVVPGKTQSLLGRNWLQKVKLDWQKLFSLSDCQNINLQNILNKHKAVFNYLHTIHSNRTYIIYKKNYLE